MENPKLALIPSGYKSGYSSGKVYSILPVDGVGDFYFSRGAEATRVRKDGLIETVTNQEPRLDWLNSDCPSLLLEPQRTNRLGYSEQFNTSNWGKSYSTIDPDSTISPNGELSSDKLIANTVNTNHYLQATVSGLSTSSTTTFSIFIKKAEISQVQLLCAQNSSPYTNWARIKFDLDTLSFFGTPVGAFGYEDYSNGWVRLFTTGTPTSSNALIRISLMKNSSLNFAGNDNDGLYLFGAQVEQGSYPSSYIKTLSGTVTRLKDGCTLLNQTFLTDYPFTVYAKAKVDGIGNTVFSLNNTSSNQYYLIFYFPNSSQVSVGRASIGINDFDNYNFSYSVGDIIKVAVSFTSATSYKLYINGVVVANITSGSSIPFNHDDISLGQLRITGDTGTRNSIDEFRIYDKVLTEAEAKELTTI